MGRASLPGVGAAAEAAAAAAEAEAETKGVAETDNEAKEAPSKDAFEKLPFSLSFNAEVFEFWKF